MQLITWTPFSGRHCSLVNNRHRMREFVFVLTPVCLPRASSAMLHAPFSGAAAHLHSALLGRISALTFMFARNASSEARTILGTKRPEKAPKRKYWVNYYMSPFLRTRPLFRRLRVISRKVRFVRFFATRQGAENAGVEISARKKRTKCRARAWSQYPCASMDTETT